MLDAEEDTLPRPSAEGLGILVDYPEGLRKYEGYLVSTGTPLDGMKVALIQLMEQLLPVPVKSLQTLVPN